jgi:predicted transcriptional regulator
MSHTLTVRVPDELAAWLETVAKRMGLSQGAIVREQLEKARLETAHNRPFMRLAGVVKLDERLSTRKGFSKT